VVLMSENPGMRPLLVANYDFVLGGGEVGLRMLLEALAQEGHRPLLAVPGKTPLFAVCEERSIPSALAAGAMALRQLAADCELLHVFSIRSALMALLANTSKPLVVHLLMPNASPYDPIVSRGCRRARTIAVVGRRRERRSAPPSREYARGGNVLLARR